MSQVLNGGGKFHFYIDFTIRLGFEYDVVKYFVSRGVLEEGKAEHPPQKKQHEFIAEHYDNF